MCEYSRDKSMNVKIHIHIGQEYRGSSRFTLKLINLSVNREEIHI